MIPVRLAPVNIMLHEPISQYAFRLPVSKSFLRFPVPVYPLALQPPEHQMPFRCWSFFIHSLLMSSSILGANCQIMHVAPAHRQMN